MPEVLGSETTRLLGDQKFIVGEHRHRHRHRGPCAAASVGLDEEVQVASANNNQQSYCRVSFTVVLAGRCGVYHIDLSSKRSRGIIG